MHAPRSDLLLRRQANAQMKLAIAFAPTRTIEHDIHIPTQEFGKGTNGFHPNASAGNFRDDLGTGNARNKNRVGDFVLTGVRGYQFLIESLAMQNRQIQTLATIGINDLGVVVFMPDGEDDFPLLFR